MYQLPVPPTLVERLRDDIVRHCGPAPLSCTFVPGGKLHGVGISSELYCQTCHCPRLWHDVAEAAAIVDKARGLAVA